MEHENARCDRPPDPFHAPESDASLCPPYRATWVNRFRQPFLALLAALPMVGCNDDPRSRASVLSCEVAPAQVSNVSEEALTSSTTPEKIQEQLRKRLKSKEARFSSWKVTPSTVPGELERIHFTSRPTLFEDLTQDVYPVIGEYLHRPHSVREKWFSLSGSDRVDDWNQAEQHRVIENAQRGTLLYLTTCLGIGGEGIAPESLATLPPDWVNQHVSSDSATPLKKTDGPTLLDERTLSIPYPVAKDTSHQYLHIPSQPGDDVATLLRALVHPSVQSQVS